MELETSGTNQRILHRGEEVSDVELQISDTNERILQMGEEGPNVEVGTWNAPERILHMDEQDSDTRPMILNIGKELWMCNYRC